MNLIYCIYAAAAVAVAVAALAAFLLLPPLVTRPSLRGGKVGISTGASREGVKREPGKGIAQFLQVLFCFPLILKSNHSHGPERKIKER